MRQDSTQKKKNRKGAVQVQFTWIFALIAGAVILLFFVQFISQLLDIGEDTMCTEFVSLLDTVFVGAETALGTVNNISLGSFDMTFDCTTYSMPECSSALETKIIFASDRLKGNMLISYAEGFDMPYRSANILYLTTPETRYVFVRGGPVETLYDMMPDGVQSELVQQAVASSLEDMNHEIVRVVVNEGDTSSITLPLGELNTLSKGTLSVIGVESIAPDVMRITFFEQDAGDATLFNPRGSFEVAGDAALLGAVFAGNSELFNCTMDNVLEHYQYMTEVLYRRSESMRYEMSLTEACRDRYALAGNEFSQLRNTIIDYKRMGSPGTLMAHVSALSDINEQLKLYSCPTLY